MLIWHAVVPVRCWKDCEPPYMSQPLASDNCLVLYPGHDVRFVPANNVGSVPLLSATGCHILRSIFGTSSSSHSARLRARNLLLLNDIVELVLEDVFGMLFGVRGDIGVIQRASRYIRIH